LVSRRRPPPRSPRFPYTTLFRSRNWGLANPHYEWWGPFGRGWVNERTFAQVTAPVPFPVIAYPPAWADGTDGLVSTDVVLVPDSDRKSTRLNSSHVKISYAVFCL